MRRFLNLITRCAAAAVLIVLFVGVPLLVVRILGLPGGSSFSGVDTHHLDERLIIRIGCAVFLLLWVWFAATAVSEVVAIWKWRAANRWAPKRKSRWNRHRDETLAHDHSGGTGGDGDGTGGGTDDGDRLGVSTLGGPTTAGDRGTNADNEVRRQRAALAPTSVTPSGWVRHLVRVALLSSVIAPSAALPVGWAAASAMPSSATAGAHAVGVGDPSEWSIDAARRAM
ncbi:MAG: hypothetical protein WCO88_16595, partial [Actinomycetota bacterium]